MSWISGDTIVGIDQLTVPNSYYTCIDIEDESIFKIGKKSEEELDKIVETQWILKKAEEMLPVFVIVSELPEEGEKGKIYVLIDDDKFSSYIYEDGEFLEIKSEEYKIPVCDDWDDVYISNEGTGFGFPIDLKIKKEYFLIK